jgi:hypothetical protein
VVLQHHVGGFALRMNPKGSLHLPWDFMSRLSRLPLLDDD